jgi:hypothetical protein
LLSFSPFPPPLPPFFSNFKVRNKCKILRQQTNKG